MPFSPLALTLFPKRGEEIEALGDDIYNFTDGKNSRKPCKRISR
jgi:hypothetical protein